MTTADRLLARILEHPNLVPAVRQASPETFCAVVEEVGLADAGELLALATREQFLAAVDTSVWAWDGDAEQFDHAHFVTWLEVLYEGGGAQVVRRLLELPEETLVLAFSGQLFVLDTDTLGVGMAGASWAEAELAERVLDACLYLELADHVLVARQPTGWDVVVAALLELDQQHHDVVVRVLEACARSSASHIAEDGLESLLSEAETIAEDARAEKNDRRAKQGHVSAEDAAAFLRLAAQDSTDALPTGRDAITAAHLRTYEPEFRAAEPPSGLRALLEAHHGEPAHVADVSALEGVRRSELAYLANLLLASGRVEGPAEAATLAVDVVAHGMARARALGEDLSEVEADRLFRLGWACGGPWA